MFIIDYKGDVLQSNKAGESFLQEHCLRDQLSIEQFIQAKSGISIESEDLELNGKTYRLVRLHLIQNSDFENIEHINLVKDIAKVGSWSFNIDSGKISWSSQMFDIFPEKESDGEPEFDRHRSTIHPEDVAMWEQTVQKCMLNGEAYTMQFRTIHPNEKIVWVRAHGRGTKDQTGKVTRLQGTCQDITLIKELEIEKKEAESLNLAIQNVAKVGGWRLNLATGETQWTLETYKIHEIPEGTPTNKIDGINFYAEHERPKLIKYIEDCAANGTPFDDRFEFTDAKGNKKWVRSIGQPISNSAGKITHLEGTFHDVTETVKREQELEESQTYFALALKGANLGIWDWYLETNAVKFDKRWAEMVGLDFETIKMELSTWESRVHPDDIEQCYADIKAYIDGKTSSYENIHRMKHADGHWVYILDRGQFSEWDENGIPTRFTGTHMDITELESLRAEKELILSQAKIGTFKWDIQKNFVEWDKNNYELYEVDEKDFSNAYEAWEATLDPDWKQKTADAVQLALDGVQEYNTIFRIITPSGVAKFIRAVATVERDNQGNPLQMWGVNMDATAQVHAEQELEKQRELESHRVKLASIGELAAGVGHEINNPLAIINGYISVLDRMIVNNSIDPKTFAQITKKMNLAGIRIKNIVKGLRNFSRVNDEEVEPFDLLEVTNESIFMIKEIYQSEGVRVIFNSPHDQDEKFLIEGVRGQIQQIIVNLISNAKDATDGQRDRIVEVKLYREDHHCIVEVIDNGIGIPPSVEKKIFDPFFTTKDVNRGTGIGLSMAHRLVANHKGTLTFNTQIGEGTQFFIRIPECKKELDADSLIDEQIVDASAIQDLKAMVVDDETDLQELVTDHLEILGIETICFSSPIEALEHLSSTEMVYDFIISDMKMPKMNGKQFLEEALKDHNEKFKHFLFMTGGTNINFEDPTMGVINKIDGFLYKPFTQDDIEELLFGVISSENNESKAA